MKKLLAILFICLPAFGSEEIPGGDLVHVEGTNTKFTVCRLTNDWEIRSGPNPFGNAGGDEVKVFPRKSYGAVCDRPAASLETIGNFMAVKGALLILDTGTGIDGRTIHAFDLSTSTQVFSSSYSSAKPVHIANDSLVYWTADDRLTTSMKCKFDGWQQPIGVDIEVYLNLGTLKATETGRRECVRRE